MKLPFGRIHHKLEKQVLVVVILPMSLLLFVCFFAWTSYLEIRLRSVVEDQGVATRKSLESEVAGYSRFLETVGSGELVPLVYREIQRHKLKAVAAIFDQSGLRFSSYPLPDSYLKENFPDWGVFRLLGQTGGRVVYLAERVNFFEVKKSSFTIARTLSSGPSAKPVTVVFFLPMDDVVSSANRSGVPVNVVVTDSADRVVYTDDPAFIDPLGKIAFQGRTSQGQSDFVVSTQDIAPYRLKVYSTTSLSEIRQMERFGLLTMVGIILCGLVFFLVLSRSIVGRQMLPMESILQSLEDFSKGNFAVRLDIRSHDEFELIATRFNELLTLLSSSISNLVIETRAAKEAEIKQLEAQFNPHFLFNTIDSVAWMLRLGRTDHAVETLTSLSTVLRYSIDRTGDNDFSSVGQDQIYLKLYLSIMRICLDGGFHYTFHVEKALLPRVIPKLILQPLLENAVKHGKLPGKPLKVEVSMKADPELPNTMTLMVRDTGKGFALPRDHWIHSEAELGQEGFGIASVIRRLRLLYGESFGFHLFSAPAQGTIIHIHLPGGS